MSISVDGDTELEGILPSLSPQGLSLWVHGLCMAVQRRVLETNCVDTFKLFSAYPNWRWSLTYINIGLPDCMFSLGSFWSDFSMGGKKEKETVAMLYWNKVRNLVFVSERSWVHPSSLPFLLGTCGLAHVLLGCVKYRTGHGRDLIPTQPSLASHTQHQCFPGVSTENVYQQPIFRRTLGAVIRNSYFHWISQEQNQ